MEHERLEPPERPPAFTSLPERENNFATIDEPRSLKERFLTKRNLISLAIVLVGVVVVLLLPSFLGGEIKPPPTSTVDTSQDALTQEALNLSFTSAQQLRAENSDHFPKASVISRNVKTSHPQLTLKKVMPSASINATAPGVGEIVIIDDVTQDDQFCALGRSASGNLYQLYFKDGVSEESPSVNLISGANSTPPAQLVCK